MRVFCASLVAAAALSIAAHSALATPENTGLNENFFTLSSSTISPGQSITGSAQFSLSNPSSGGFSGTTTRTFNGNTVTFSAGGSSQGSSAPSVGAGGSTQTFTTGSLTYFTPGTYNVSIGGSLSWHSTENSSYGLGQGNGDASLGYGDNRNVTVLNVAPQSVTLSAATINEGSHGSASMTATSPGTDQLTFSATGNATASHTDPNTTPGATRVSGPLDIGAYNVPGVYTVTGQVTDNFGGSTNAPNALITVLNVAPQNVTMSTANINAGDHGIAAMTATNPGSNVITFHATGTAVGSAVASQTTPGSTRTGSVDVGAYYTPGVYTVTGSASDAFGGSTNAPNSLITVLNVAPQNVTLALAAVTINEGQHGGASMTATSPGTDQLTFNVNGHLVTDPNTTPGSTRTSGAVDLGQYNVPGVYTIPGSVSDNFGGSASATSQLLTVLNVAPILDSLAINSRTPVPFGASDLISFVAAAHNPGGNALTYAWNLSGAGGPYNDQAGNNPTIPVQYFIGTHTIGVQVSDAYGGVTTGSLVFTVIPEPASLALLGLGGGVAIAMFRRRRRR